MYIIKTQTQKRSLWAVVGLLLFAALAFTVWTVKKSQAGAITNITISESSSVYTITLTPASAVPAGGKIYVAFQDNHGTATSLPAGSLKQAGTTAAIDTIEKQYDYVLVATTSSQISAGTAITLVAGDLTNPTTGRYYATVSTTQADDTSIDGSLDTDSDYRGYYTIGTPYAMGRITDPNGDPVEGAWVNFNEVQQTMGGSPSEYGYDDSDDQGYYDIGTLEGLGSISAGTTVKVYAHAPGSNFNWGTTSEYEHTYSGSTITQNMQFTEPTKTISGYMKYADDTPIANAGINFWSMSGSGWSEDTTDSNGYFEVTIRGGRWEVMPRSEPNSDWMYSGPPNSVTFENDSTVESQTVNITVQRANCTLTGSIRLPNGSIPSDPSKFNVNAFSMSMGGNSQVESDGSFSINLAPGSYKVDVTDQDMLYSTEEMDAVSLSENETLNIGTITLVERTSVITGKVLDVNGNVLGFDNQISAFQMRGMGWANAQFSAVDGSYSMNVFPGKWMLNIPLIVRGNNSYILNEVPPAVEIEANETKTVNLVLAEANAVISGSIMDTNGEIVTDTNGFVFADKAGSQMFMGPGMGGMVDRGTYTITTTGGVYNVGLGMMPGSDYSSDEPTQVTAVDNQTVTHNITVYENDMTVTGEIRDEDGNQVTGVFLEVFATNKTGAWQGAFVNSANGTYSLSLASAIDPWSIGYFVDSSTGYFTEKVTDNSVSGNTGDTITKNITIRKADATISGTVVDGDGSPMEEVMVFADNRAGEVERSGPMFMGPMFMNENITNSNGEFSIDVPNGTYYLSASVPRNAYPNLINPKRVEVTVEKDGTVGGVQLAFLNADCEIAGNVELDGEGTDAYVWAWSEDGGYNETQAEDDGSYTLNVTQDDTWHVGVNNDVDDSTNYIQSTEQVIETGSNSTIGKDLECETVTDGLVSPLSTTYTSTNAKVANLSDGSKVTVPANALATSGNVTLNATTTSEMARTTTSKPIGTGMEITANTSTGSSITSLNSNVTLSIPYDEDGLEGKLVTEDDLVAAYWDDTNGLWQPMDSYSIDKENDKVTFTTSHFTTFAIVADTAEEAAEVVEVEDSSDYRRAKVDKWKAVKYMNNSKNPKERIKLKIRGRYFARGDEPTVTIGGEEAYSVKVKPGGKYLTAKFKMKHFKKKKYDPKRTIRVTNPGTSSRKANKKIDLRYIPTKVTSDEFSSVTSTGITNLQTVLRNQKLYKEKKNSGVFDAPTKEAVVKFQLKYGIAPSTGVVGPLTKAKLREVMNDL